MRAAIAVWRAFAANGRLRSDPACLPRPARTRPTQSTQELFRGALIGRVVGSMVGSGILDVPPATRCTSLEKPGAVVVESAAVFGKGFPLPRASRACAAAVAATGVDA
jgi:hypothetical protein